jgi:hypothetical protein
VVDSGCTEPLPHRRRATQGASKTSVVGPVWLKEIQVAMPGKINHQLIRIARSSVVRGSLGHCPGLYLILMSVSNNLVAKSAH